MYVHHVRLKCQSHSDAHVTTLSYRLLFRGPFVLAGQTTLFAQINDTVVQPLYNNNIL